MEKFERYLDKKNPSQSYIEITVKDGRVLRLVFALEEYGGYLKFCDIMDKLLSADSITDFFAFKLFDADPSYELEYNGWNTYSLDEDFRRQNVELAVDEDEESTFVFKKIKNRNQDNEVLCRSYPPEFVVPSLLTNEEMIQCSKFRSRGRLPVLVYVHRLDDKGRVGTLWRSSQVQVRCSSSRPS